MKWQGTVIVMMAAASIFCALAWVDAGEKIMVGRAEEVLLLPQGVKLPARIDTGAAICSLDARDLTIKNDTAEFRLPEAFGGQQLRLPVVRYGHVRSTNIREKRPIVELEIRLGPKLLRVEASLTDRSQFKRYPVLIGRNALKQGFLVDVSKWNIAPTDNRRKAQTP
jgi:hypothetical protein